MENFTPIPALAGGLMIGVAAVILMKFNGRIAGVSNITQGVLRAAPGDVLWRVLFLAGMIIAPQIYNLVVSEPTPVTISSSIPVLLIGGLLVGFGASAGRGCTSGHGVCGIARFSRRSLAATATFMATAVITVYLVNHVFGAIQ